MYKCINLWSSTHCLCTNSEGHNHMHFSPYTTYGYNVNILLVFVKSIQYWCVCSTKTKKKKITQKTNKIQKEKKLPRAL